MKRLNRKGFTLIELMAVIAILIIIMGIALPNITSSIERSKQKQKEAKIRLIESAAELYFDRHKNFDKTTYSNGVSVSVLVSEGLITEEEIEGTCDNIDTSCCVGINLKFKENHEWCWENVYDGEE